ncbi:hypothetical protein [Streptomyces coffeae]|uniref:Integral membrane protein n=1 Tax=Streptomyces coffeae TaxID=621382 RepID=A0ABS1NBV7_9ACTN|nr:hypothetical protein [Streptomyces coffeae]MBL1097538.1 hypothetical protein [Streptomyces coffeae]
MDTTTRTDHSTDPVKAGDAPEDAGQKTAEGAPEAVEDRTESPDGDHATDDHHPDHDPAGDDRDDQPAPRAATPGVLPGAAAVVAAGLGFASVSGTWLGTMMQERKQLTGQIAAQSGSAGDQIAALYGTPWHTAALVNGIFALAAVVIAAVVLTRRHPSAPDTSSASAAAPWITAVAWGAVLLGILGLLIAAAMGLDLFTALPTVPSSPGGATG